MSRNNQTVKQIDSSKNTTLQCWTLEERIEELRGKLQLKERDNEAYVAYCNQKLAENEVEIRELQKSVKGQQVSLARYCLNGDRDVILNALHENPVDQLTYQRTTAERCLAEKNQDVFDQVKKLNMVKHQHNMAQQKISELELTLSKLKAAGESTSMKVNDPDTISEQRLRILSTQLDKINLKINSARYVNHTYKKLLAYLEKDSLSLPSRLDQVEDILENQKYELTEIKKIHRDSKNSCDVTRLNRSNLEQTIMKDKHTRDRKLTNVRKNLKQLQDEADNFNMKTPAGTSRRNNRDKNKNLEAERESVFTHERGLQKECLETALYALQETVGASKVEQIAESFESQLARQNSLLNDAEQKQLQREKLINQLAQIDQNLSDTKYANGEPDSSQSGDRDETQEATFAKTHMLQQDLDKLTEKIELIETAFDVFYKKTCSLDTSLWREEDNPDECMNRILSKFSAISKKYDQCLTHDTILGDKEETTLTTNIQARNVRIDIPSDDELGDVAGAPTRDGMQSGPATTPGAKAMFDDDDDALVETTYISRDDIKKTSKELIYASQPKKKGGKKK